MRRFSHLATSLCLILGLAAVGCDDDDDNNDDRTTFGVASMTGANEVPPNASTAQGSASFDLAGGTVTYSIQLQNITEVTAAHIHLGAAGANGPVVVALFTGPTTGPVSGLLVQSTFSAADVASGTSFESLIEQMRNRGAYVNVHSNAFPDGEIRGQIEVVEP
jgi:hypothetical protein